MNQRSVTDTGTADPSLLTGGMPSVVREVIELVSDSSTNIARLSAVLMKEPELMKSILRKANTPVFGFKNRVKSIDLAIVLLGFDTLQRTVSGVLIHNALRKMVDALFRYEEFWNHSVACAMIARYLGERSGACDPDDAFVAGLFHDIGYLLVHEQTRCGVRSGAACPEALRKECFTNHTETGRWVMERWQLPQSVVEAVRFHHTPELADIDPPLTAVVHAADVLCHARKLAGFSCETLTTFSPVVRTLLALDPSTLPPAPMTEYIGGLESSIDGGRRFEDVVREMREHLVSYFAELPDQQKIILALSHYEGLAAREIARLLHLDESTVIRLQNDAVRRVTELDWTRAEGRPS